MSGKFKSDFSALGQQGLRDLIISKPVSPADLSAPLQKARNEALELLSKQIIAIKLITDQDFLMEVALGRNATELCVAAVSGITNQEYLKRINSSSHSNRVRAAAVLKINDSQLLKQLILEDQETTVVDAACAAIDDQGFMSDYLKNAPNSIKEDFRKRTVLRHITDQTKLKELTAHEITISGRSELTTLLFAITDQDFVKMRISENISKGRLVIRQDAFRNVTDQDFLKTLVNDESVRFYHKVGAVRNIDDSQFILSFLKGNFAKSNLWKSDSNHVKLRHALSELEKEECEFVSKAIARITDIDFLREIDMKFEVKLLLGNVVTMRMAELEGERSVLRHD